ncbi:MAG: S-layer homology domain-containing protein, partial [Clostridia bacterium]
KTATPSFTPAFSGGGDTTSNLTINASAGEGGTITPSGKLAVEKNGSMSFAIKPNEGYSIDTILVDGKAIGKVSSYTFKNVTENHSIAVTFKKGDDFAKFIDVKGHWAESAMRFVFENEIMSGMSQITFEPETELSRAMLVTMLYRIDGKPAVSSKPSFKDVASGMWYTDAIAWAEANKIISGMGDGNFAPNASIQRQQMAAILYRYMQFKGRDVSGSSELTAFTDAKMIGDWALPAMKWAVQEKLISGRTASTLEPLGTAKRAEVAMVMMRWLQK